MAETAFQQSAFQNNAFQFQRGNAFQCNAFQLNAFQTPDCEEEPVVDTSRDPGVYVSAAVYARRFRFMR